MKNCLSIHVLVCPLVIIGNQEYAKLTQLHPRCHATDASFKSYVYDDITLRFTYELDENNFFTKYEYDASGKLERIKKETERGVMTVQETRFSNKKSN